ncbi:Protein F53B7.3 [Aphelenchoides avenae]|nr:Protein F53B7.3 [Aphelenchus avenae]
MTALARWRRMKEQEEKGPVARRPNDVKECKSLADAERYRREIIGDISKKIAIIQNPGLGEFKIRDLNDEINRMLRLKYAWEGRVKELGGPDYRRIAPREVDREGREVASNRGYKYFGAAKDLPGVRELFQQAADDEPAKKSRAELSKYVDADYYGYMDDDDGFLVPLEKAEEEISIGKIEKEWEVRGPEMNRIKDFDTNIYKMDDDDEEANVKESVVIGEDGREMVIRHVIVPSQQEIEQLIAERKKQDLMERPLTPDSD